MQSRFQASYLAHDPEYQRRRAAGYPGWYDEDTLRQNIELLGKIFAAPHFPRKGRLLEVGCGAGDWSIWAAEQGYQACGVDISPTAVAWAIEKCADRDVAAQFRVGDAQDEIGMFDPDTFDVVLDGHCFHCIMGDDRERLLRAIGRVLKAQGIFHINTMCGTPTCDDHLRVFDPASRCLTQGGIEIRYLGLPESIEEEVAAAGFSVVDRTIMPRRSDRELDLLLLDLTKF